MKIRINQLLNQMKALEGELQVELSEEKSTIFCSDSKVNMFNLNNLSSEDT